MTEFMPVDLHQDGILWLINRMAFHPRGFALAVDPETHEFFLQGNGDECFVFTPEDDDEGFEAVEMMFVKAVFSDD